MWQISNTSLRFLEINKSQIKLMIVYFYQGSNGIDWFFSSKLQVTSSQIEQPEKNNQSCVNDMLSSIEEKLLGWACVTNFSGTH